VWLEIDLARVALVEAPLEAAHPLARAWASLASVVIGDPRALAIARRVCRETVVAPDWIERAPAPPARAPARAKRRTAAHPRGYEGTIARPPKSARAAIDLRPFLFRLDVASRALGFEAEVERTPRGPREFEAYVAPSFSSSRPDDVQRARVAHEACARGVIGRAGLAAAVALCALDREARHVASWLELASVLPPDARRAFIARFADLPPASIEAEHVAWLGELAPRRRAHAFEALSIGLRRGADAAYVRAGLDLDACFSTGRSGLVDRILWDWCRPGRGDPTREVLELLSAVEPLDDELARGWFVRAAWALSADRPRAALVFALAREPAFDPAARRELFELAIDVHEGSRPSIAVFALVRDRAARVQRSHQAEFVRAMRSSWCLDAHDRMLAEYGPIASRAAEIAPDALDVLPAFGRVLGFATLGAMSDDVYRAIARASRRRNDAVLIAGGVAGLGQHARSLVEHALVDAPRALLRLCRSLGVLHASRIGAVVARARREPLFGARSIPEAIARDLVARLHPLPNGLVPRALRRHLDGSRPIARRRVERHLRNLERRAIEIDLALVADRLTAELRRTIDVERSPAGDHAALLFAVAHENRRGLRRLLRARSGGDRDVIERHPASLEWLAAHPRIDRAIWRDGVVVHASWPGSGSVVLAFERDPLEVLAMGTYVQTCLGLGGSFAGDAAGIALDVNKRVVFARNARGRAVARQLVSIAEDDELVCHRVYPTELPAATRDAFREFDRRLAAALAIPICTRDEHLVVDILSAPRWDDGRWRSDEA
jgi:hypothetical protein